MSQGIGSRPSAASPGIGSHDDRNTLRQIQQAHWVEQAATRRARLKTALAARHVITMVSRSWWESWRQERLSLVAKDGLDVLVGDCPDLVSQLDANSVALGMTCRRTATVEWRCSEGHTWNARIRDRAERGTPCRTCVSIGTIADVEPLLAEYADDSATADSLSETADRRWRHDVWALDPATGEWYRAVHKWLTEPKTRVQQLDGCRVCAGYAADNTNSLATWYPHLADQLVDRLLNDPRLMTCTSKNKETKWTCGEHTFPQNVNNRVANRQGCPHCHNKTPRAQAELAAELATIVNLVPPEQRDPRLPEDVPDLGSNQLVLPPNLGYRSGSRLYSVVEVDILLEVAGTRVGIEYDGEFYHGGGFRDRTVEDARKDLLLAALGVPLIRVREGALLARPGVHCVAAPASAKPYKTALAVLSIIENDLGLPVLGLSAYKEQSRPRGSTDAKRYLEATNNSGPPRKKVVRIPKPPSPRSPIALGTRFGPLTVRSAPRLRENTTPRSWDRFLYDVECDCGNFTTAVHWTLRNQPPLYCGQRCGERRTR
jgi:Probable Zinc-ribbon domain